MPEYRINEVDDKGQPTGQPSVGVWKDDNEALRNAGMLFRDRAFEMWCGDRKITTPKPNLQRWARGRG